MCKKKKYAMFLFHSIPLYFCWKKKLFSYLISVFVFHAYWENIFEKLYIGGSHNTSGRWVISWKLVWRKFPHKDIQLHQLVQRGLVFMSFIFKPISYGIYSETSEKNYPVDKCYQITGCFKSPFTFQTFMKI